MNDTNDNRAGAVQRQRPADGPVGRPPRGISGKAILALLAGAGLLLWIGATYSGALKSGADRIAGLVWGSAGPAGSKSDQGTWYTCGMHPWVLQPKPGKCPVCHMDLVPVDPAKLTGKLALDPVVVQNIGVRVAPVTIGPLTQTIRTVGTVDYNETAVRDVNIKLAGWIEKLYVNYMGERVTAGQPLLELYAPDLYAAQQEYLLALKDRARSSGGPATGPSADSSGTDIAREARDLLSAARTRLEYYDITPEQIAALQQRGEASKTMTIYSPYGGVVIAKNAFEGMRVEPGTLLFRIADLSTVWVMVALYEYQLPYVQVGQQALMTLSYIPGEAFEGKVIYVYPTLDEKTRQVRVRLEFANPRGLLKPGMFAEVQLRSTLADDRILVPREAIIDTGQRQVAFVSLGQGRFEPRQVQMGVPTENGMVQVLSGLKSGEMVVTSGQFLLDSESRIREALAKMVTGESAVAQKTPAAPASGPSESVSLPPDAEDSLIRILHAYLAIGDQLAKDTTADVPAHARVAAEGVATMLQIKVAGDPHFWHRHEEAATIRGKALQLADGKDLAEVRLAYADMSVALGKLVESVGVPVGFGRPLEQLHCPMFREGQGGSIWLQSADVEVRNPYFGQTMLHCFDERKAIPAAAGGRPGPGASQRPPLSPDDGRNGGQAASGAPGANRPSLGPCSGKDGSRRARAFAIRTPRPCPGAAA